MNSKQLKITFTLPGAGSHPVGGYKVIYEYANHLCARGHRVTVVHPARLHTDVSWVKLGKSTVRYLQRKAEGSYRPDNWFNIDNGVSLLWSWSLNDKYIPDADIVIATSWETAEWVNRYPEAKGKHFYLAQGLETWSGAEKRVLATWKMPFKKIVIAKWLKEIADDLGEEAIYIQNGLNFNAFGLDASPEVRNQTRILMLHHRLDLKGSADGLAALNIVKRELPDLRATLFGVSAAPSKLPDWIEYHRRPSQPKLRELYNHAAIFLSPSWSEGWPLPPAEAMMCGAALVATDIGGHKEYATHEETALLSPPKDAKSLAENLLRLIRNPEFRIKLAQQGNAYIQRFTWKNAVDRFEAALLQDE